MELFIHFIDKSYKYIKEKKGQKPTGEAHKEDKK